MKYWKVVITLQAGVMKAANTINIIEEDLIDTIVSEQPIVGEDGSEQSFSDERVMYKMLWKQLNMPHYSRMPLTPNGEKMLESFVPYIEKNFPEIMI